MKFQPKPGDKIICNNGEEFICCTLEFLHNTISTNVKPSEPILGYDEKYSEWQDWEFSGQAAGGGTDYNIREVIPQSLETPADKKEEVKEEPRFTIEEVLEAIQLVTQSAATWNYVPEIKEHLNKSKDPQYMEYLQLKAIYE